jgi:hypothetical protein
MSADDISVRMQVIGPRNGYECVLAMRRRNGVSSASYRVVRGRVVRGGAPTGARDPLEPKLPWEEIWARLADDGFLTLPDENARPECETEPVDVDAERIVVEVRRAGHDHHFSYTAPRSRRCAGGLRLMRALGFLQDALGAPLPFP